MDVMRIIEYPFSVFLRDPKRVVRALARGDVLLRRRGAGALRLTPADRHEDRLAVVNALARLMGTLATRDPAALRDAVVDAFPWATFLPKRDQHALTAQLCRTLTAATEVDNLAPVAQLLAEWKATAEIHADTALAKRLSRPVVGGGRRVPAPAR